MIKAVNSINCSNGGCKPSALNFSGKNKANTEENKLTGFNKFKDFLSEMKKIGASVDIYSKGTASAFNSGITGGAIAFGLIDFGSKLKNYDKAQGGIYKNIIKPYGTATAAACRKAGSFIGKLFEQDKTFGRALGDIAMAPLKFAKKFVYNGIIKGESILSGQKASRAPKVVALAAFLVILARGLVKTKIAVNLKHAQIDYGYRIEPETTIQHK